MVTTAEAILELRQKGGWNQQEFAQQVGIAARTISRYENGAELNAKVLGRLAELAAKLPADARAEHLRKYFETQREAEITYQVQKLSPGGARRVAVEDLRWFSSVLSAVSHVIETYLGPKAGLAGEALQIAQRASESIVDAIDDTQQRLQPYLDQAAEESPVLPDRIVGLLSTATTSVEAPQKKVSVNDTDLGEPTAVGVNQVYPIPDSEGREIRVNDTLISQPAISQSETGPTKRTKAAPKRRIA